MRRLSNVRRNSELQLNSTIPPQAKLASRNGDALFYQSEEVIMLHKISVIPRYSKLMTRQSLFLYHHNLGCSSVFSLLDLNTVSSSISIDNAKQVVAAVCNNRVLSVDPQALNLVVKQASSPKQVMQRWNLYEWDETNCKPVESTISSFTCPAVTGLLLNDSGEFFASWSRKDKADEVCIYSPTDQNFHRNLEPIGRLNIPLSPISHVQLCNKLFTVSSYAMRTCQCYDLECNKVSEHALPPDLQNFVDRQYLFNDKLYTIEDGLTGSNCAANSIRFTTTCLYTGSTDVFTFKNIFAESYYLAFLVWKDFTDPYFLLTNNKTKHLLVRPAVKKIHEIKTKKHRLRLLFATKNLAVCRIGVDTPENSVCLFTEDKDVMIEQMVAGANDPLSTAIEKKVSRMAMLDYLEDKQ